MRRGFAALGALLVGAVALANGHGAIIIDDFESGNFAIEDQTTGFGSDWGAQSRRRRAS